MKKLIAVSVLTVLAAASTSYAGAIGPLPLSAKAGETTFSAGYFFSQADWETENNATASDAELQQNQVYAQLGHQLSDNLNVYARAGAANYEADKGIIGIEDFDGSGYKAFGGLGMNFLIRDGESVDMGFFAQGNFFSNYNDRAVINGTTVAQKISTPWDASAGLTFQGEVDNGILYGGPLLYIAQADLERDGVGAVPFSDSPDYEESGVVGAFVGISWEPVKEMVVDIEVQVRSNVAGGLTFNWGF